MKYYFDGVIVVEGTSDSSFLSSYIDALYLETNGFDISSKDIEFLQNCHKNILVLTDSDEAGKSIRKRILNQIDNAISIELDINKCNKNNKHGVAECDINEIIGKLNRHLIQNKIYSCSITNKDLFALGINNKKIRNFVSKELKLGVCNNKEFLKRINFLNISYNTLKEIKERYRDN